MPPKVLSTATGFLFLLGSFHVIAAESLREALRAADVPVQGFAEPELSQSITSYTVSTGDPFLLAYYVDDGSGLLHPPLHVVRIDRGTGNLRRVDIPQLQAPFQDGIRMDCLGSALRIREHRNFVYIETHVNPSAGCTIVLSSLLSYRAALSGSLLGLLGSEYAIVQRSEIHFASVHPLHIAVYDAARNRSVEVYPPEGDVLRRQYSRLIRPHISKKWCSENNAQCDPDNFNTDVDRKLAINEAAKAFGFEATFDAMGFGEEAAARVAPRTIFYIYRERGGIWQYREFEPIQLQRLFGVSTIGDLVMRIPDAPFDGAAPK